MKREGNLKLLISISHGFWIFLSVFVCIFVLPPPNHPSLCRASVDFSVGVWGFYTFKHTHTVKTKRKWHSPKRMTWKWIVPGMFKSDFQVTNLLSGYLILPVYIACFNKSLQKLGEKSIWIENLWDFLVTLSNQSIFRKKRVLLISEWMKNTDKYNAIRSMVQTQLNCIIKSYIKLYLPKQAIFLLSCSVSEWQWSLWILTIQWLAVAPQIDKNLTDVTGWKKCDVNSKLCSCKLLLLFLSFAAQ